MRASRDTEHDSKTKHESFLFPAAAVKAQLPPPRSTRLPASSSPHGSFHSLVIVRKRFVNVSFDMYIVSLHRKYLKSFPFPEISI